jgi:hypothetical protein
VKEAVTDLPKARLVPKDNADHVAILKSRAAVGAKVAGRTALGVGKVVATIGLLGAALAAIGSTKRQPAYHELERRLETIRLINSELPKYDYRLEYTKLLDSGMVKPNAPSFEQHLRMKRTFGSFAHEAEYVKSLTPSQRELWPR